MSNGTPQKSSKSTLQEPADLQLYQMSAEKRRRVSHGQSPTTPAKVDSKAEPAEAADQGQAAEPESPELELSEGEADVEPDVGLSANTRIQVLMQELQHIKQELDAAQQTTAAAQAEKARIDIEADQLRRQLRHLAGANIENCNEEELYEIQRMLERAQGRVTVERTRQAASKHLNRRLDL